MNLQPFFWGRKEKKIGEEGKNFFPDFRLTSSRHPLKIN